jgi:hypothetical protein
MNITELLRLNKQKITDFAENKYVTRTPLFIQAWKKNQHSNPNGDLFKANNRNEFCRECTQFRNIMKDIGTQHELKLKDTKTPDYIGSLWLCDIEFERTDKSLGIQKQINDKLLTIRKNKRY